MSEAHLRFGKTWDTEERKRVSEQMKGSLSVFNLETHETYRIPVELYHSRKDLYVTVGSPVYKEWKLEQANKKSTTESVDSKKTPDSE